MNQILKDKLQQRKSNDQFRVLKLNDGIVDFSSNDYLGLSRNTELATLIESEYKTLTTSLGSGGSRLLAGNSFYFEQLEEYLAEIHQSESSLLMNSGYVANLAVFSSIPQKGDTVLYDELIHACVKDGMRLSLANHYSFKHNDLESLENKLKRAVGTVYVAVESVYSMDGDEAPLIEIVKLCKQYGAYLIVDEAHTSGVYGKHGSGLSCALGIEKEVFVRIQTFGKGLGCHGACVVASKEVRDFLINFARPFIYTTAMPLHGLVTIRNAYDYLSTHLNLQAELRKKITLFREVVETSIDSVSAIQVVVVPGNNAVKKKAQSLQKNGFDVRPVMSPTVKEGSERLRICLHVYNTEDEIITLGKYLKQP